MKLKYAVIKEAKHINPLINSTAIYVKQQDVQKGSTWKGGLPSTVLILPTFAHNLIAIHTKP